MSEVVIIAAKKWMVVSGVGVGDVTEAKDTLQKMSRDRRCEGSSALER